MPNNESFDPRDSNRVQPLDINEDKSHFLIQKFSREPIWHALNKATNQALPKWAVPSRPQLRIRNGIAVWEYRLPQDFSSVKPLVTVKGDGRKKFTNKTSGNPRQLSSGVKADTLENLLLRFEGDVVNKKGAIVQPKLTLDEAQKLYVSHAEAYEQWQQDKFRVTVLWESICAAIAVGYYIWNRSEYHVGGEKEEEHLQYLTPFFAAVGIDIPLIWKIAFTANWFAEGKKPKFKPGKPSVRPMRDHYMAKEYDNGKRKVETAFGSLPEIQQKLISAASDRVNTARREFLRSKIRESQESKIADSEINQGSQVKQKSNTKKTKAGVSRGKKERE